MVSIFYMSVSLKPVQHYKHSPSVFGLILCFCDTSGQTDLFSWQMCTQNILNEKMLFFNEIPPLFTANTPVTPHKLPFQQQ